MKFFIETELTSICRQTEYNLLGSKRRLLSDDRTASGCSMSLLTLCTVAQHACPFPPNPKRAIKQPSTVAAVGLASARCQCAELARRCFWLNKRSFVLACRPCAMNDRFSIFPLATLFFFHNEIF